jgi:hypothetical protein
VRHVRMLGLCLVAALAIAAVAASSAVAGPQWVKCELVGPGHNYTGPNCTKAEKAKPKGTGEYELYKAAEVGAKREAEGKSKNVPFTGANIGSGGVLYSAFRPCVTKTEGVQRLTRQACTEKGVESEGGGYGEEIDTSGAVVECTAERNSGETSGSSGVANVKVVFSGCEAGGVVPCTSAGAEEGEVRVNTLVGKLGYISKSEHKVGLLLEPATKHGRFAEFNCGGLETVVGVGNKKEGAEYVQGTKYPAPAGCFQICPGATPEEEKHGGYDGIISRIEPANEMTSEFKQTYSVKHEGFCGCVQVEAYQNVPSSFEGKHIDVLEAYLAAGSESYDWSSAAEEITNSSHPEEAGEIKA